MMIENITFSSEEADNLNNQVKKLIASHLFLVCNYNPESIKLYSDDARFIQASLNIYKFLVDAGICNNLRGLGKKYRIRYDYNKLDEIIKIVNAIRTTLGHNIDERNGTDEDKDVVEQWFLKEVGKKQLDTAEEYKKAVKIIEKYGEECTEILSGFIDEASKNPQKTDVIKEWEGLIINFYKRSNSNNIFEGQLMMAYQVRLGNVLKATKVDVAGWVQKMSSYSEQSQINNLQEIMRKSSFPASILKNIGEKIEQNKTIIAEKNKCIASFTRKNVESLRVFDYWDYYLSSIPGKIQEKLEKGDIQSLLPQDAIQQIIEEDFKEVPII